MNRISLQIVVAILGIVGVVTGIVGLVTGVTDKYYGVSNYESKFLLDSNLRFFSGIWFCMGIWMLYIVPTIERQKTTLRVLSFPVFFGGIGRIISMFAIGFPPALFIVFAILELAFPLLLVWQHKTLPASLLRREYI
ncbi:MAG: DUF4345 domain-containing protein [Desulfobacteraceae bacterium]|nr:DUF4345 domain-containing protein [Desulfobacteraceae bacterium]